MKSLYTTDSAGRIATAHARPLLLPLQRLRRAPHHRNAPGKLSGDHAGHLFADMFDGSPGADNIVSQLKHVNQVQMADLERDWARRLSKTPPDVIDVDIDVKYDATGSRPIGIDVYEWVDGKSVPVGKFKNQ